MPSQADIRTSIMQTILDTHASAEKTLPWRPTWIPCKHCLFCRHSRASGLSWLRLLAINAKLAKTRFSVTADFTAFNSRHSFG